MKRPLVADCSAAAVGVDTDSDVVASRHGSTIRMMSGRPVWMASEPEHANAQHTISKLQRTKHILGMTRFFRIGKPRYTDCGMVNGAR